MIKNYFKTAWRNLVRSRFYSLINIGGLTMGLTMGILILLWVQDELSFDSFHKNTKNIWRLENRVGTGTSQQIWQETVAPIGQLGTKELPEIKASVRITYDNTFSLFTYKDKLFKEENTGFTDPSFFSVFDFPLIKGNAKNPFPDNHSIILTASTAKKYFGEENPVGKIITADGKTLFTVSGIISDFPENSSIRYDMLLPMNLLADLMYTAKENGKTMEHDFSQFNYSTYLLLQPATDLSLLAVKLRNIHLRNKPDDTDLTYLLLALADMHLYRADGSDGGIGTVRMFTIIALLILVIACINYVNLSTARAMLRAKEISLRKIIGAGKLQLFMQFILETSLLFLLSAILSIGLIYLLMPVFNQISGKQLAFNVNNLGLWKLLFFTIMGTLAASSIYPALLLSSFEPLKALKGKISARISDVVFRKVLVVTQFAFSVILIVGTLVIGKQLQYIRSKNLGYNKNNVFAFSMREMNKHFDAIKAELLQKPGIAAITSAGGNIIRMGGQSGDNSWDGKGANETFMVHPMSVDKDFIPFFKMTMATGENFSGSSTDSAHFIFNETAVKALGMKDPVGKRFRLWKTTGTIIGVIKDFHFASMKQKIEPAVFYYNPANNGAMYIKTTGDDPKTALASVETVFKKYNGNYPFSYVFLDDNFNALYRSEEKTGTLFNVFALMAIVISCLGLLGLASFTAQIRTREIGVRKVLGASVPSIVGLMAKDFIKLVLIAIILATPIAWFVMNQWLRDFAYKIDIGWTIFLFSGLIAMLIAVLTISYQSIKAATANPVNSLRTE